MSACCSNCSAGKPCCSTRLGGTRVGLPGANVQIRVKPSIRGSSRMNGLGLTFLEQFSRDYKPGSFTNAFQAGFAGPQFVRQATSAPTFSLPYSPSLSTFESSGSTRLDDEGRATRAVAAIQSQDFDIPIPVINAAGVVQSPSGSRRGVAAVGALVLGIGAFFLIKKFRKAKPAAAGG